MQCASRWSIRRIPLARDPPQTEPNLRRHSDCKDLLANTKHAVNIRPSLSHAEACCQTVAENEMSLVKVLSTAPKPPNNQADSASLFQSDVFIRISPLPCPSKVPSRVLHELLRDLWEARVLAEYMFMFDDFTMIDNRANIEQLFRTHCPNPRSPKSWRQPLESPPLSP